MGRKRSRRPPVQVEILRCRRRRCSRMTARPALIGYGPTSLRRLERQKGV